MDWLADITAPGPLESGFVTPLDGVTLMAVTSLDGRAAIEGTSAALGNPADAELLQALRSLSDVVVVGAGTVRAEDYGPATPPTRLAVLSRSWDLDPDSRLFSDPANPPILLGGAGADHDRRAALEDAGAELVDLGDTDPRSVVAALRRRGLSRITVEGGPGVYRDFLAAGVVDRIHLTVSPMVAGAGPATFGAVEPGDRDAGAPGFGGPLTFRADAAAFSDSHLFVRYQRRYTR